MHSKWINHTVATSSNDSLLSFPFSKFLPKCTGTMDLIPSSIPGVSEPQSWSTSDSSASDRCANLAKLLVTKPTSVIDSQ